MFFKTAAPPKSLAPEAVLMLLGGKWPDNFAWKRVTNFRSLAPGMLQGFEEDEPIGPALIYTLAQTDWRGKPILHFSEPRLRWGRVLGIEWFDVERTRTINYKGRAIAEFHYTGQFRTDAQPEKVGDLDPNAAGKVLGLRDCRSARISSCIDYIATTLGLSEFDRLATLGDIGPNPPINRSAQR